MTDELRAVQDQIDRLATERLRLLCAWSAQPTIVGRDEREAALRRIETELARLWRIKRSWLAARGSPLLPEDRLTPEVFGAGLWRLARAAVVPPDPALRQPDSRAPP